MKTTKKILALVLAVVMMAALCIPAMAADDGTITIRNATIGETYTAYKIFDLAYGTPLEKDTTTGLYAPVSYTYTKTGDDDALYTALTADGTPFVFTETDTTNVYSVTSSASASDISDFLTPLTVSDPLVLTAVDFVVANGTDATYFYNLSYGYYLITSTLAGEDGKVVTIDSTLPNVTVIDKNQEPTWDDPGDDPTPDPENPDDPDPRNPKTPGTGKAILIDDPDNVGKKDSRFGKQRELRRYCGIWHCHQRKGLCRR